MGKRYAITGESGTGKSTFLSILKGTGNSNIKSSGSISYPIIDGLKSTVIMVTQHEYFPLDSTLLESIYYPNKFTSLDDRLLFEKQVIKLLNEININSSQSTNVGIISLLNEKLD